jgi:hypothetical protein
MLLAHTLADGENTSAEIEPLLGRLTDPDGRFGHLHSEANICWKPGTRVPKGCDKILIGYKGVWKNLNH